MMLLGEFVLIFFLGVLVSFLFINYWNKKKEEKAKFDRDRILLEAEKKSIEIVELAKEKREKILNDIENQFKEKMYIIENEKERISERERVLNETQKNLLILNENLRKEREELEYQKEYLKQKENEYKISLEKISGMTSLEAKAELIKKIEEDEDRELFLILNKLKKEKLQVLEEKAREILVSLIQRYSGEVNHNLVSTVVELKNDDEKGKIIGKEGRNIRTFERLTGVQLIIDDSPEIITISSFDPIRREVAARVLNKILADGIVQPAKIEEYYEISKREVDEILLEKGNEALAKIGYFDFDKELIRTLGMLHFRTSYGQNVLQHSIEVAHFAGMIASEIGADVNVAKLAGLFHDIGKALDHQEEGSHVEIGIRLLKRFGIHEEIIKAMRTHHGEYQNENLESYIVEAADKISASRPGARNHMAEHYLEKLEGLEKITSEFKGVQESYAISAGREIRVFVKPEEVNDYLAQKMAKDIAKRIEEELKYPGEIKVAVIREKRVVEYAK